MYGGSAYGRDRYGGDLPGAWLATPTLAVTVKLGLGGPTTPLGSVLWEDVSQYTLGLSTKSGRQHELSQIEAGTASIRLDNKDRRFDPSNTSSPYYPYVRPFVRAWIQASYAGTTYDIFNGFVQAWPMDWPDATDAYVTLDCVDARKVLGLIELSNPYQTAVMALTPDAYWRLGETDATQPVSDSSGHARNGTYIGTPTFSQTSPVLDSKIGATLFPDGSAANLGSVGTVPLGGFTIALIVKGPGTHTNTRVLSCLGWSSRQPGMGGYFHLLMVGNNMSIETYDGVTVTDLTGTANVNDGKWHHVVVKGASGTLSLEVDGVADGSVASTTVSITPRDSLYVASDALTPGQTGESFGGSVAEVALWQNAALTNAQISGLVTAMSAWANDLSGTRVGRLLDACSWPAADRSIEVGLSTLQADGEPGNGLTNIDAVADAENGVFYINPSGQAVFLQRSHIITSGDSRTSRGTFGEGYLPYLLPVDIALDDLDIWNDIQCQRSGGPTQYARDATSQSDYGIRTLSQTGLKNNSDLEMLDRANWFLSRYKHPSMRVRSVEVTPFSDPDHLYPHALGRQLWDRITFHRQPPGGGSAFQQESLIEGISHEYTPGAWKTSWHLSPADVTQYLILDDTTYGALDSNALAY